MIRAAVGASYEDWRRMARSLLRGGVAPHDVVWAEGSDGQLTLPDGEAVVSTEEDDAASSCHLVPREFVRLAAVVACHRDAGRWALLYRTLYRLTHDEKHLLSVSIDGDVRALRSMERSVGRDVHKMKAFVRFRAAERDGETEYIAWHRPDHLIVERTAPWFVKRFGAMRWSILTPDRSVYWDAQRLRFGPGVPAAEAPAADALEELWRLYYASVFNPARLKIKAMKAEMPVRHWRTLPEAQEIPRLVREAAQRETLMLAEQPSSAAAFLPARERTLPALARAVAECRGCELSCAASRAVFGEGPAAARVVIVGEQPGDAEDRAGRPFVGPAGRVLDRALADANLERGELYVTNAVKHFKYELAGGRRIHRSPNGTEVAACQPWLAAEIAAIKPRLIVCLGATATLAVMGQRLKLTENRGVFLRHHWAEAVFLTAHPSFILRLPEGPARDREYQRLVADFSAVRRHVTAWDLGWGAA